MLSLPTVDYSPLAEKFVSDTEIRKELGIKSSWLPDSQYHGGHAPFSMGNKDTARAARLHRFALHNNFGFIGNLSSVLPFPRSHFHSLATLNFPTMITSGVIMKLETGWLEIGELRLDNASSYKSEDSRFTYIKVTLEQQLPDFTIDSRSAGLPTHAIGKPVYITESKEFNQTFSLYLGRDHAHAGLKILSPDVMSILIDHFSFFDIEMRDHTISLITHGYDLLDSYTFKGLLETTAILVDELSYQVRNPVDARVLPADIDAYKQLHYPKKPESPPSKFGLYGFYLILVLVTFSIILSLIGLLLSKIS